MTPDVTQPDKDAQPAAAAEQTAVPTPGTAEQPATAAVDLLLPASDFPAEVAAEAEANAKGRQLTLTLARMRTSAGVTVEEMGRLLGKTPDEILALENGWDDFLQVRYLRVYAKRCNCVMRLSFAFPESPEEKFQDEPA